MAWFGLIESVVNVFDCSILWPWPGGVAKLSPYKASVSVWIMLWNLFLSCFPELMLLSCFKYLQLFALVHTAHWPTVCYSPCTGLRWPVAAMVRYPGFSANLAMLFQDGSGPGVDSHAPDGCFMLCFMVCFQCFLESLCHLSPGRASFGALRTRAERGFWSGGDLEQRALWALPQGGGDRGMAMGEIPRVNIQKDSRKTWGVPPSMLAYPVWDVVIVGGNGPTYGWSKFCVLIFLSHPQSTENYPVLGVQRPRDTVPTDAGWVQVTKWQSTPHWLLDGLNSPESSAIL